jgi:hypothetical protein
MSQVEIIHRVGIVVIMYRTGIRAKLPCSDSTYVLENSSSPPADPGMVNVMEQ